jgi:hypothetical protein
VIGRSRSHAVADGPGDRTLRCAGPLWTSGGRGVSTKNRRAITAPRLLSPSRLKMIGFSAASLCIYHKADCTSSRDDEAAKPPMMQEE